MDAIGYDLATPEPSSFALFGLGIAATIYLRRKTFRT